MTQEELAAKTGVSARSIQRIENGEVEPRAFTLRAIASALETDFGALIHPEGWVSHDSSNDGGGIWLPLMHLSGLFNLLIPSLTVWFWKKNKVAGIREHGIDVINFQLSMLIFIFPAGLFAGLLITIPILILLGMYSMFFVLLNTIKVMNHQKYKYPTVIRILTKHPDDSIKNQNAGEGGQP
jgi:transcriptional regulator with XRE-family HTH domain